MLIDKGLTFDDVLLVPGYSTFAKEKVDLTTVLHKKIKLTLPVISSPMDQVTETEMAIAIAASGGLGIIHRSLTIKQQIEMVRAVKKHKHSPLVGAAIGLGPDMKERVEQLIKAGVDLLVIDSAQGHSSLIIDSIKEIKKQYPGLPIMAGNVATYDGAKALIDAGADILRVGIGPGSICSTRVITGVGVPQLTAVMEASRACKETHVTVVADGGIKQVGDIAKALAAGASAVMLGSLLACREESPGETVIIDEKKYKTYRGMGSQEAVLKGSSRYGQSNVCNPKEVISEGVSGLIEEKGNLKDYLYQVQGSLRSSFFYIGGKNLKEFQDKTQFIQVTQAGMQESHPHSITITTCGGNYNKL